MTKNSPRRHGGTEEEGAGMSPAQRQIAMNNILHDLAQLKRLLRTPERSRLIRSLIDKLNSLEADHP